MSKIHDMKNISCIVMMCLTVILTLSGCGGVKVPQIDEYEWQMSTVQSKINNGQIVAYGTDEAVVDKTPVVVLVCKAENGSLTITDNTNNQTYSGTYTAEKTNVDSVIYNIEIEGIKGTGVSAFTTYSDESRKPTLIFTLEDYTIIFLGK